MSFPSLPTHPEGEGDLPALAEIKLSIEVDTFDGKVHFEWDPDASVTTLGQLPFFLQFLKLGQRFDPWVDTCPLDYTSNNASVTRDILGSIFLSVLSGHTRYAHISTLIHDTVNTQLLGMTKIVSDDTVRRALKSIDKEKGNAWLQSHLSACWEPLLKTPWILDVDVTVKPLYGHQEEAVNGYNPHKPGRPCHTFHTYMVANMRLILDVEVKAGNLGNSSHSLPGLIRILNELPVNSRPAFVRGDCDWGSDNVMSELEDMDQHYLFKMKKTKHVKTLILEQHQQGNWQFFKKGWETKEAKLKLSTWKSARRVVLVRRLLKKDTDALVIEQKQQKQLNLSFVEGSENIKIYEYSVLVTNLDADIISIVQHYRDRADCENNFDELKNQWGWGGYTTQKVKSCQFISRIIALIYNWWTLYVRLLMPDTHLEAITSRPLMLCSVGRLTETGRQKKMSITSNHHKKGKLKEAYSNVSHFFYWLKSTAPQLTIPQCWQAIIDKILILISVTQVNEALKSPP
jgi:uncharacterized beta-barrel protein YwiB (DUF1934 family)